MHLDDGAVRRGNQREDLGLRKAVHLAVGSGRRCQVFARPKPVSFNVNRQTEYRDSADLERGECQSEYSIDQRRRVMLQDQSRVKKIAWPEPVGQTVAA